MDIKVKVDLDKLGVFLTSVNEKAVKQAVRRSIARTFTGIKTAFLKETNSQKLYDRKKLPTSKLKGKYFFERKSLGAGTELANMYAALSVSTRRIDLIAFFAKRVQRGVLQRDIPVKLKDGRWVTLKAGRPLFGAEVKMFGKTRFYEGDFIGNIGKTSEQVFRRRSSGKIFKRTGPSLDILFRKTDAATRIQNEADARLQRELDHNMSYFLSKI